MIQIPNAVGLTVCQQAIIEEGTKNVTLVNTFTRLAVKKFPTPPQQLVAHALLTDGIGTVKLSVIISRMDTLENIIVQSGDVTFTDPLHVRRPFARFPAVQFPVRGYYQVTLLANGEWVAQGTLKLVGQGD
jgi:hypothetical protein